jgi:hypothetical protein
MSNKKRTPEEDANTGYINIVDGKVYVFPGATPPTATTEALTPALTQTNRPLKRETLPAKNTQIGLHAVSQYFGDTKERNLFSKEIVESYIKDTGLEITDRPDSYGVVMSQSQFKVFEGILSAFSDTNYAGHLTVSRTQSLKEVYRDKDKPVKEILHSSENAPYRHIENIPVVKLTQSQIIELSGHSRSQGDKTDVIEAIDFLGTKQFCFYWSRLKTENGKPVKDKRGDFIKEEVMEVGSILRIKTIRNEAGELQYYEIHPSAPVIDQVNNYFLLVPNNWREEVKEIAGTRASSYTYQLLLWLRVQFEYIRRHNSKRGKKTRAFVITKSWEEVAQVLKMPKTMYKANRKRALKIIQEAYAVAIKLGYLVKVENNGAADILHLNEGYYPKPGKLV